MFTNNYDHGQAPEEVWKANVENDVEVIVDPTGFTTKELKEKGYKVKCTSLEKQFCNHFRKETLEGMVRENVRCIPERVGCTPKKKRIVFEVSEGE